MTDSEKLDVLLRHISNVRDSCELLGLRLIQKGDVSTGHKLIAHGQIHDQSKFVGIEWKYLYGENDSEHFKLALAQHVTTNPHHPEYWGDIKDMPRVYVAEMVCDWKARSSEFGTDLREWIKERAMERFEFSPQTSVGKEVREMVELLLDKAFV